MYVFHMHICLYLCIVLERIQGGEYSAAILPLLSPLRGEVFQDKISNEEGFQFGFHTLLMQVILKSYKGVMFPFN